MPKKLTFTLKAIVDQDFGQSVSPAKVDPPEMAGKPQLHVSKMRVQERYEARNNGRVLQGGRVLQMSKEECKDLMLYNALCRY